ncbi:RidA family protein [bacterium]|nr:RidA family protein [bacterium]
MSTTVVKTDRAPKAIGPYEQAIRIGNLVYTSGQLAIDLETGKIDADTVEKQTELVLTHLGNVLEAAGSSLNQVLKTTVFITNMAHFPKINEIYARFFNSAKPARSTVAVAALPLGALVEIEAVAYTD